MKKPLRWPLRILLFAAALLLIDSGLWTVLTGLAFVLLAYCVNRRTN